MPPDAPVPAIETPAAPAVEAAVAVPIVAASAPEAAAAAQSSQDAAVAAPAAEAKPAAPTETPSLLEAAPSNAKAAEAAPPPESPAPSPDAKAAETPAPEAAKTEGKKDEPAKDAKAPEAKPADKPEADAAKPDPAKDATAQPEPPAPVKYEAFKVPDGIKLADDRVGKFTEIAGAAQVKQEVAQQLIDLYIDDVQRISAEAVTHARQEQRRVWDTFNDTNKTQLRSDPELGGNRLETSLSIAKAVVEEYAGGPEQAADLLRHMSNNGMGNYVGMVRMLHNIGQAMNVFEDSLVPANATAPKPQKGPGNRGWYDT